ncbi:rab11 family-interacting protein 1 isoform X2 [Zophobas morio]|uniref:rab11 family-interacting protein 1 isoform X2 n=1 Tax=Zophobas morio TaxID=2755281 RepID=UPI003083C82F
MWMPTHVQVTVQRASGLLTKGKHNKNDCFVTIALGKTKYQTSVKEKADPDVEWHEECELPIPDQGNTAEIILTVLHHNSFGVDEFLGRVAIPLNTLDIYERPKNKWYGLEAKPGKVGKAKERGHLEVKIGFTVKSGSLTDLSKKEKHKSSLSHVAQSVGGSLLSLGSAEKRKGIKKFAKSIGSKMHLRSKKKDGDLDDGSSIGSVGSLKRNFDKVNSRQTKEDADPGVVSDEDEFTFDDLSHKSSISSLNQPTNHGLSHSSVENLSGDINKTNSVSPAKPPRSESKPQDEWESKLFGKQSNKDSTPPDSGLYLNGFFWKDREHRFRGCSGVQYRNNSRDFWRTASRIFFIRAPSSLMMSYRAIHTRKLIGVVPGRHMGYFGTIQFINRSYAVPQKDQYSKIYCSY